MADCIHGLSAMSCTFCRGGHVAERRPQSERRYKNTRGHTSRWKDCHVCPHGYLVHGARGCWLCACPVSWSALTQRVDGVRSEHFPGAKR